MSRVTFDSGLQAEPTWSPDGRFIAYSSDKSGSFDIWVQPVDGGRPVQVTTHPAHDWQPDWSPDGKFLVFRSERDGGGIFLVPALGGHERRLTSFGLRPSWSPDGSKILFVIESLERQSLEIPQVFLIAPDGSPPSQVLAESLAGVQRVESIAWHPDRKRVSFWGTRPPPVGRHFSTIALSDGPSLPSELAKDVERQIREAGVALARFRWAPSGDALYFEGVSQQLSNLWKVSVDPRTLRWVGGPERLTTGFARDSDLALSDDGRTLTYAARSETIRAWSLPFDSRTGRVSGNSKAVTADDVETLSLDLSSDGQKLIFAARRPGKEKIELRQQTLENGREALLGEADGYFAPRWSRDGTRVAYRRTLRWTTPPDRLAWMVPGGDEEHLLPEGFRNAYDWSSDGESLLHTCPPPTKVGSLCTSPLRAANTKPQIILDDADHSVWQGRFCLGPPLRPGERLTGRRTIPRHTLQQSRSDHRGRSRGGDCAERRTSGCADQGRLGQHLDARQRQSIVGRP